MKDSLFEIVSNRQIAKNTYEMVISGDISDITAPGQFVNLKLEASIFADPSRSATPSAQDSRSYTR